MTHSMIIVRNDKSIQMINADRWEEDYFTLLLFKKLS